MAGFWFDEYYRRKATGSGTSLFIGVDLGQSRDPTAIAIVRKVENPTAEDLVSMPVVTREPTGLPARLHRGIEDELRRSR